MVLYLSKYLDWTKIFWFDQVKTFSSIHGIWKGITALLIKKNLDHNMSFCNPELSASNDVQARIKLCSEEKLKKFYKVICKNYLPISAMHISHIPHLFGDYTFLRLIDTLGRFFVFFICFDTSTHYNGSTYKKQNRKKIQSYTIGR